MLSSFPLFLITLAIGFIVNKVNGVCISVGRPSIKSNIERGDLAVRLTMTNVTGTASCPVNIRTVDGPYESVSDGFVVGKTAEVFQGELGDEILLATSTDTGVVQQLSSLLREAGQDGALVFPYSLSCGDGSDSGVFYVRECSSVVQWEDVTPDEKEFLRSLSNANASPSNTSPPTTSPSNISPTSTSSLANRGQEGLGLALFCLLALCTYWPL